MIAGTSPIFPKIEISNLVEELGGIVVFDESCAERWCRDSLFENVKICQAKKAGKNVFAQSATVIPNCPGAVDERVLLITRVAEVLWADGLLFYVLKGFDIYDMVLCRVEKDMKEKNIPLLRIETDYGFVDTETFKACIEAFIESLPRRFAETRDR